jgi:hypothetical protein
MHAESRQSSREVVRAAWRTVVAGLAALFLTTVHHVYGAYVYATPWRLHVAHVSGVAAVLILGSFLVFRQRVGTVAGTLALALLVLSTLMLPVVGIGLIEGGYNHAVKVALYSAGASPDTMRRLFPPPAYELPNDAFFEATGVLQLVPGLVAGRCVYRLIRARRVRAPLTSVSIDTQRPATRASH